MTQDVETASATGETDLPAPKERRRLREIAELTHEDLASTLGVTTNTARSWENGRTDPRGRKREAYAKLLTHLAHLAAERAPSAEPPTGPTETPGPTEAPGPTGALGPTGKTAPAEPAEPAAPAATTARAATSGSAAPASAAAPETEADGGSDADADTEAGPTPASEPARRMAGAVRAFVAGGQGRPAGRPNRPKGAAKRATKSPASSARHESKSPVRSGSGPGGGHPGGAEPPPAPATPEGRNRSDTPAVEVEAAPADKIADKIADRVEAEPETDGTTPDKATTPKPAPAEVHPDATGAEKPEAAETDTGKTEAAETDAGKTEAGAPDTDRAGEGETEKDPAIEAAPAPGSALTPAQAFDALYAYAAPALARQTYLLTGRRALSLEAVERAFQNAWERWPEVATDPDPVGWVRAAAYEHALSPWQRLRRAHRNPDQAPAEPADRILMDAMLALPTTHRRTVLLYDGVGLDLPDTAAETEASTPTTGIRLLHAHADLADRIPELAAAPPERHSALLRERLGAVRPPVRLEPREASVVRVACERRARLWSRAAIGLTAVIAVATAYTLTTAPTRYEPPVSPGANVTGVPPHSGPQALTERSKELHDTLRFHPAARPDRLTPTVG